MQYFIALEDYPIDSLASISLTRHYNSTKKYPILIGTIPLRPAPSASEISSPSHESQFISKNRIMPMPSELDITSITSYPDSPPTNDSFNGT